MRHTSVDGRVSDHSTDPTHMNARLWDFDVDDWTLKENHTDWLDAAIKRMNTSNQSLIWKISVTGTASLTGTWIDHNRHNATLGYNRAQEVENYIRPRLKVFGVDFDPPFSAGTMFASWAKHKVGVENDEDRSAYVVITTDTIPPPPPPKPTSIPLSKHWAIKYIWGDSLSTIAIGADAAKYDIADLDNHIHAIFEYSGVVIAGSVSKFPLSVTLSGDWKPFSTSDAIYISDFEGPARFSTAGVGPATINYLTLTPKGGALVVPSPIDIPTGWTLGAPGASITVPKTGWLRIKSDPLDYSGHYPT